MCIPLHLIRRIELHTAELLAPLNLAEDTLQNPSVGLRGGWGAPGGIWLRLKVGCRRHIQLITRALAGRDN